MESLLLRNENPADAASYQHNQPLPLLYLLNLRRDDGSWDKHPRSPENEIPELRKSSARERHVAAKPCAKLISTSSFSQHSFMAIWWQYNWISKTRAGLVVALDQIPGQLPRNLFSFVLFADIYSSNSDVE